MITKEQYDEEHLLCPRCGNHQLNISNLGHQMHVKPYTSCHTVACPRCKWKGIVDELCIERPKDRLERIISMVILVTIIHFICLAAIIAYMVTH